MSPEVGRLVSVGQPVAASEEGDVETDDPERERRQHGEREVRVDLGEAQEAVPDAVDHVHHRVEERRLLEGRGNLVERVEDAAEEHQRAEDELVHHRQVVAVVGPEAADDADRGEEEDDDEREGH